MSKYVIEIWSAKNNPITDDKYDIGAFCGGDEVSFDVYITFINIVEEYAKDQYIHWGNIIPSLEKLDLNVVEDFMKNNIEKYGDNIFNMIRVAIINYLISIDYDLEKHNIDYFIKDTKQLMEVLNDFEKYYKGE